jgi:hypothetical protein
LAAFVVAALRAGEGESGLPGGVPPPLAPSLGDLEKRPMARPLHDTNPDRAGELTHRQRFGKLVRRE